MKGDCVKNWRFIAVLMMIVGIGVMFRLWNFTPALGNDDQRWIITSQGFGKDHVAGLYPVYYSRILWRLVLSSWGAIVGLSLTTTPYLMFGLSCVTTVLIALAGRLAFGPRAGLWAAAVYATHPMAVVYDTLTLPDGLAIALLAAIIYLFLIFLRQDRLFCLVLCGFLVGLLFSAKTYFILAALPIVACLMLRTGSLNTRFRNAVMFSVLVFAGIAVDMILHCWESGNWLARFSAILSYGDRIQALGDGSTRTGIQRLVIAVLDRFAYGEWLFLDVGFVCGFLTLWACVAIVNEARTNVVCLFLSFMVCTFAPFLLFCPAKLSPLIFVEMQPRYLGILLPMIAISAGMLLSQVIERLPSPSARRGFLAAIVCGFLYNLMVPNDLGNRTFNRSDRMVFDGIRHELTRGKESGCSEFVFPDVKYKQVTPDSYYALGLKISFYDTNDIVAAKVIKDRLLREPSTVLFVPRAAFKLPLVHALSRGEYQESLEVEGRYQELVRWLRDNGFSRQGIRVPNTVFRAWMCRAGMLSREQQLIGWIYRREQPQALDKTVPK